MTDHGAEFDQVILSVGGGTRSMDRAAFLALPLTVRVRHLLAEALQFRLEGQPVSTRNALRGLAESSRVDEAG